VTARRGIVSEGRFQGHGYPLLAVAAAIAGLFSGHTEESHQLL
jgi:hypothetical protein